MEDRIAVSEAVKKFLAAGIIEISPTQSKHYLSHFFTVKEPTKRRPILDCRPLNKFVQCHHFKMEGIPALRSLLEKDDLICKIDLKDAYVVVPLHQQSRRFLTFLHQGTVYQYKSLAFGLSVAPRIFSKPMRYAVEPLRRKGIKLVYYLDDICLVAKSMKEMNANMQETLAHLKNLGFLINYKKSSLQPQKIQEFLGFQFNTSTMQITLPQQKLKKIVSRIRQVKRSRTAFSCRWIASLVGKMTAVIPAIGEALIHLRFLQRDLAKSLHVHHQNWESPCQLTRKSFEDLQWWENFSGQHNGLPIHKEDFKTPAIDIYVDASDSGYGVSSAELETHGFWTKEEQSTSINVRELKTVWIALQLHAEKHQNNVIRIFSDSTTAIKYVMKTGGTASPTLQDLALQIQSLLSKFQIRLQCVHIPGIKNTKADRLSRLAKPLYEWSLPQQFFQKIQRKWGPLTIDAFAAHHNNLLPKYWSIRPDPAAMNIDAFKQHWPKQGLFLHPPWKLIPQVLRRFQQQKVQEAILVTPFWPTQYWYPMILQMTRTKPLLFQISKTWRLAAWKLSDKPWKNKIWT